MKKISSIHLSDMVGPLGFLVGWIGLCAFLLTKYADYYMGIVS